MSHWANNEPIKAIVINLVNMQESGVFEPVDYCLLKTIAPYPC